MARKSNKTAHVLNLLSGQSTNEEPEKEAEQPKEAKTEGKAEESTTDTAPAAAPVKTQTAPPAPEVPTNISIIDNAAKEADPIADRIHDELLKELELEGGSLPEEEKTPAKEEIKAETPPNPAVDEAITEEPKAKAATAPVTEEAKVEVAQAPVTEEAKTEAATAPVTEETKAEVAQAPVTEETKAETATAPTVEDARTEDTPSSSEEAPEAENTSSPVTKEPKAEAPTLQEPEEEILDVSSEPPEEPEPPVEPEPDYVMLNVMQRVVEDKIIYFMKQFEVCTCDRCKADTIALTLSGLPAKYRIVDKHAVDPLVSYYTGRLISQVTVEALKACTQVKDNPRH